MSGIIYEEDEDAVDTEPGSDVEDVAELERILEESEQESQHEESGAGGNRLVAHKRKMERPKSALSILQRHVDCGSHQKKTIHWKDEAQLQTQRPTPRASPAPSSSAPANATPASPSVASVSSFRRSLKLLGLQPRDFGMQDEKVEKQQAELRRRPPRPLVSTRLHSRSVSLDDLRAAAAAAAASARGGRTCGRPCGTLTPDVLRDGDVYKMFSSAVYEEWYFRKQREELERKRKLREEERRQHEELEQRQADIKKRSQEKFEEWLQRKTQELRKINRKGPAAERAVSAMASNRVFRVVPEQAEKAFQEWKKSKDEQRAARGTVPGKLPGNLPGKQAAPDSTARREEAEKAYQLWKERAVKQQKQEAAKRKRREENVLADKQKQEEEKREMSRKSFEHWKTVKDEEQRMAEEESRRRKARAEALEADRREQRQYEAQQAFLAWLDQVDEREAHRAQAHSSTATANNTPLFSFRPARRHSCST